MNLISGVLLLSYELTLLINFYVKCSTLRQTAWTRLRNPVLSATNLTNSNNLVNSPRLTRVKTPQRRPTNKRVFHRNYSAFTVAIKDTSELIVSNFRRRRKKKTSVSSGSPATVAAVKKAASDSTVSFVSNTGIKLTDVKEDSNDFLFKVIGLNNISCDLSAMLDSGSSISHSCGNCKNSF